MVRSRQAEKPAPKAWNCANGRAAGCRSGEKSPDCRRSSSPSGWALNTTPSSPGRKRLQPGAERQHGRLGAGAGDRAGRVRPPSAGLLRAGAAQTAVRGQSHEHRRIPAAEPPASGRLEADEWHELDRAVPCRTRPSLDAWDVGATEPATRNSICSGRRRIMNRAVRLAPARRAMCWRTASGRLLARRPRSIGSPTGRARRAARRARSSRALALLVRDPASPSRRRSSRSSRSRRSCWRGSRRRSRRSCKAAASKSVTAN